MSSRPDAVANATTGRGWLGRAAPSCAVLAVFIGLAIVCVAPLFPARPGYGNPADAEQATWFLTWTPYAISHGQSVFSSDFINGPRGVNLLWNTSMPAVALLVWPVTALFGAVRSYTLLAVAGPALSAFLAYMAIRRYVPTRWAAAAGGLLYGFSPYMVTQQEGHIELVIAPVLLPVALILFDDLVMRQGARTWLLAVLLAITGVFTFFVNEEVFTTELIAALVLCAVLAMMFPGEVRLRSPYILRVTLPAAALVTAALAYPVIGVALLGPNRLQGYAYNPELHPTDLLNLVIPTSDQLIAPGRATAVSDMFTGGSGEWSGYLGVPLLLLLAGAGLFMWRRPVVRAGLAVAVVFIVLSFGAHLHVAGHETAIPLPWLPMTHLPLFQDILPSRLMVYAFLAIAVVLARALASLSSRRLAAWIVPLATVVALLPLTPQLPLYTAAPVLPPAWDSAAVAIPTGATVLTIPCPCQYPGRAIPWHMDGMDWQVATDMRFRIIGGWFVGTAAPHQQVLDTVSLMLASTSPPTSVGPDESLEFMSELHAAHVSVVMLGPVPDRANAIAVLDILLGSDPVINGTLATWRT